MVTVLRDSRAIAVMMRAKMLSGPKNLQHLMIFVRLIEVIEVRLASSRSDGGAGGSLFVCLLSHFSSQGVAVKAFEKRARSAFATLLSAALIVSGAVFAAPAAYAEEAVPEVAPPAEVIKTAAEPAVAPDEIAADTTE